MSFGNIFLKQYVLQWDTRRKRNTRRDKNSLRRSILFTTEESTLLFTLKTNPSYLILTGEFKMKTQTYFLHILMISANNVHQYQLCIVVETEGTVNQNTWILILTHVT